MPRRMHNTIRTTCFTFVIYISGCSTWIPQKPATQSLSSLRTQSIETPSDEAKASQQPGSAQESSLFHAPPLKKSIVFHKKRNTPPPIAIQSVEDFEKAIQSNLDSNNFNEAHKLLKRLKNKAETQSLRSKTEQKIQSANARYVKACLSKIEHSITQTAWEHAANTSKTCAATMIETPQWIEAHAKFSNDFKMAVEKATIELALIKGKRAQESIHQLETIKTLSPTNLLNKFKLARAIFVAKQSTTKANHCIENFPNTTIAAQCLAFVNPQGPRPQSDKAIIAKKRPAKSPSKNIAKTIKADAKNKASRQTGSQRTLQNQIQFLSDLDDIIRQAQEALRFHKLVEAQKLSQQLDDYYQKYISLFAVNATDVPEHPMYTQVIPELQLDIETSIADHVDTLLRQGEMHYAEHAFEPALQAWQNALLLAPNQAVLQERVDRVERILDKLSVTGEQTSQIQ